MINGKVQEISQLARFESRELVLIRRWLRAPDSPHPDDQAAGPLVAESTRLLYVVGRDANGSTVVLEPLTKISGTEVAVPNQMYQRDMHLTSLALSADR
jgi:hypothetical protein